MRRNSHSPLLKAFAAFPGGEQNAEQLSFDHQGDANERFSTAASPCAF
jgi:hypothetical protein